MKSKAEIRDAIRSRRRGLDAEWLDESSQAVERQVAELDEFHDAMVVACYVALPGEVRTDGIVEQCWQKGKIVCVPAFRPEADRYDFARMGRDSRMVFGPARVLEPAEKAWMDADDMDLVLVPGLAFGLDGARIGHGKGHYDRTLARACRRRPVTAGLGFEFQVLEQVPADSNDVKMDVVVTEKRVIRMAGA